MIISRTPYRISFFGGGTDYPTWYEKEGGAVLSTTIDKYCYISCRYLPPFFNIKHRIVWSHIETVAAISEILHPAVREGLKFLGFNDSVGLEIHHQGDLPARSGIGSSSSFSVGLIKALAALRGHMMGKHEAGAEVNPSGTGRPEGECRFTGSGRRRVRRAQHPPLSPQRFDPR